MSRSDFMKIKGVWDVKRKIAVPSLSHQADAEIVVSALSGLQGVHEVQVDMIRQQLVVLYDVTGIDYQTIIEVLERIGYPASNDRWARLKGGWYQYLDSNGRDNAHAPEPPCCSNPKGIVNQPKR